MCNPPDDLIGPARPGWIRAAWDRLCGRHPEPGPPPAPPVRPGPDAGQVLDLEEWQHQRDRQRGMPMCEKCGCRRDADGGVLHRKQCGSCSLEWLEDTIAWPLVARMGRRGARRALKRLVQGELR
jgi:hypothetical protein